MKTVTSKRKYIVLTALIVPVLLIFIYLMTGNYHATFDLNSFILENPSLMIAERNGFIEISNGNDNEKALLFYPGGKVDYEAYVPFLSNIAEKGCDVYLIKMPFNLAVFGVSKGDVVLNSIITYSEIYISGHSLGGVMANRYALMHKDRIDGVIYYASYPDRKMAENQRALLIYGNIDSVLDLEAVAKNEINLPVGYAKTVIFGGNHYNFGNYGEQKGDSLPEISRETQQKTAAEATVDFINNH